VSRLRPRAWLLFLFLSAGFFTWPSRAFAWVESHVARDDVRVTVAPDGSARVEHRVLLLVSGGPLTSISIRGVDADAIIEPGAYVVPESDDKSGSLSNAVELSPKRVGGEAGARTDIEAPIAGRGISRGRFVAVLRYKTDLAAAGLLRADGASARLDWVGAEWDDGLETTRATFVLPSAPKEPHTIDADADAEGDEGARGTFLSTLTKKADADSLEIIRPYASRSERVIWSLRVDPRAFSFMAKEPTSRGPSVAGSPPAPPRSPLTIVQSPRETGFLVGALALFVIVTSLVGAHAIEVRQRAARRGDQPRPLLGVPVVIRTVIAGSLFVLGVGLQFSDTAPLLGSVVLSSSILAIWHLPARRKSAPRGPGTWLALRAHEAFFVAPRRSSIFDAKTWSGALALLVVLCVFAGAARYVAQSSTTLATLLLFDVTPLLALFLTGGRACVTPDPASDGIELFRRVARLVERARPGVRVVPRVRIPRGEKDADEMRVVFLPARAARGLRGIELGAAYASGPGGHLLLPEIMLRYEEGSPCETLAGSFEPFGRAQRGRRPDERVQSFVPKLPTARVTADLVMALLDRTTAAPLPDRNTRAPQKPAVRRALVSRGATPEPALVSETG